ncbi:hypothetical protein, partial [Bradyrhizobium yuanmingense]|uniref:hypothetical protein n=1 Tax=Bradyrhizobium yuanmingense TaxID=108015 RepID=UPI001AEC0D73
MLNTSINTSEAALEPWRQSAPTIAPISRSSGAAPGSEYFEAFIGIRSSQPRGFGSENSLAKNGPVCRPQISTTRIGDFEIGGLAEVR